MKQNMIGTKPGIAATYIVSGGTTVGGAKLATHAAGEIQIAAQQPHLHMFLGFELSEWTIIAGICGTVTMMIFQYLNYRNNKKK